MDQQLFDHIQELQRLSYFRSEHSKGYGRIVTTPFLGGAIASAFERLSCYADPIVEIARLGVHEVHDVCWGIDPTRMVARAQGAVAEAENAPLKAPAIAGSSDMGSSEGESGADCFSGFETIASALAAIPGWIRDGSIAVRHMSGGRC